MTVVIGITGPIGCGKSTIARWLADEGAAVVDADALAHDVTALGEPGLDAVLRRFGDAYRRTDGSLDRAALGRLVFNDPAALADLEAIIHPAVRPRIEAAVEAARAAGASIVAIEAIKLIEGGYAAECDEVWLVVCDPTVQRERLIGRGTSAADAAMRIEAQGDLVDRLATAATRIIDANGSANAVRDRVRELARAAVVTAG